MESEGRKDSFGSAIDCLSLIDPSLFLLTPYDKMVWGWWTAPALVSYPVPVIGILWWP